MEDYLTPLGTVPDQEFGRYESALESTVKERLDKIPERNMSSYSFGGSDYSSQNIHGVERRIYNDLLEDLEDIDSVNELMQYTQDQVRAPESSMPSPLDMFLRPFEIILEGHRAKIFEEVFEEAKQELETQNA